MTIRYRHGCGSNKGVWELVSIWGITKAEFSSKAKATKYLLELMERQNS
jgi:hypothetical protein